MTTSESGDRPAAGLRRKVDISQASIPDSPPIVEDDEDYTSSSGSSSEDEAPSRTDGEQQSSVRDTSSGNQPHDDLKSRLSTFLSEIQRANRELEEPQMARARRIDDVDEDQGQYVEMNLGLGVLSERLSGEDGIRVPSSNDDSDRESVQASAEHDTNERDFQKSNSELNGGSVRKRKIEEVPLEN